MLQRRKREQRANRAQRPYCFLFAPNGWIASKRDPAIPTGRRKLEVKLAIPSKQRVGLKKFEDQAVGPARMCPKLAMDGECFGPTSMLRQLAFGRGNWGNREAFVMSLLQNKHKERVIKSFE